MGIESVGRPFLRSGFILLHRTSSPFLSLGALYFALAGVGQRGKLALALAGSRVRDLI